MGHKLLKKSKKLLKKHLFKKAIKKFAPELRELLILHFLNKKSAHGYEIIKQFEQSAPENLKTKANRVYPSLEKMKEKGYLTLIIDNSKSKKKPRKMYSLTDNGRKHLLSEIDELSSILESMRDYILSLDEEINAAKENN